MLSKIGPLVSLKVKRVPPMTVWNVLRGVIRWNSLSLVGGTGFGGMKGALEGWGGASSFLGFFDLLILSALAELGGLSTF